MDASNRLRLGKEFDEGSHNCELLRLEDIEKTSLDPLFDFAREFTQKGVELCRLMKSFTPEQVEECKIGAEQLWIHQTLSVELEAPQTLQETVAILEGENDSNGDEWSAVMRMKELFLTTKVSKELNHHVSSVLFDCHSVKKWFSLLMPNHTPNFRQHGCKTLLKDSEGRSYHVYPHHEIVGDAIGKLCEIVYNLSKLIEIEEGAQQVLLLFGLAAFSQFHFVDIHPFTDGNGRLCRLISKRILDYCCPFPFPMFNDRNVYFETLNRGRMEDPLHCPKYLLELMIDEAITYYRDIRECRKFSQLHRFSCQSVEELKELANCFSISDNEVIEKLSVEFNKLQVGKSVKLEMLNSIHVLLTKIESIDFENL